MTALTSEEQLLLELVNRARLDPAAEAQRLGISLNQFIQATSQQFPITPDPKQPLAGNNILALVAESHSSVVFNKAVGQGNLNFDAHGGAGDGDPMTRIKNAGYAQNAVSWIRPENFAMRQVFGDDFGTQAKKQAAIEAMHAGLFIDDPAKSFGEPGGHRLAMMDPNMKEMGAGVTWGTFQGNPTVMAFENFGSSGSQSYLAGAVYNDTVVKDDFYSLGEGVANVTASVTTSAGVAVGQDVTKSGGGWSVAEPGGTFKVTFSGGGLATQSVTVQGGNLNAKVDLVNGNRIDSSASATLGDGAKNLRLLGMADINGTGNAASNVITGNKGSNILEGKGGDDTVDGGAGIDTAVFSGKQSDYQVTVLSATSARLVDSRGIDGTDTILNIERVRFSDGLIDFSALKSTPAPTAGSVTVSDVTITEGASGQTFANFQLSRSGGTAAFALTFATANGTASAGSDYVAKTGTVQFGQGVNTQTVSIAINGDTAVEANETFKLLLSGATNGAVLTRSEATVTIVNDDTAPANTAPVVTGKSTALHVNQVVSASSLFSATDAQGNATITKYAFWDGGTSGGHFTVNGSTQAAGAWIVVDAANLDNIKYVAGATVGSEKLFVSAFDGQVWSTNASLTATTLKMAPNDFNGNGASDILWHNANGAVAIWQMNGSKIVSNSTVGNVSGWSAAGTGDFGGDSKADILWVNKTTNSVALWQMDGAQILSNTSVGKIAAGWKVGGVADFNGDSKADILLTSATGSLAIWQMNGDKIVTNQILGTLSKDWHLEGAADFTGDGKADILLRNDNGSLSMWTMDGTKVVSKATFGTVANGWHFAGAEDFNADGRADIVWRHDDGRVALWQMNGTTIKANTTVGSTSSAWNIADVGDYNHDGRADILWHHDNGSVAMWQMNGANITADVAVGSASTSWLIA